MPGAVLGSFLAHSECFPAKMIFRVELVSVIIIIGIGGQVHPRPGVVHLVPRQTVLEVDGLGVYLMQTCDRMCRRTTPVAICLWK